MRALISLAAVAAMLVTAGCAESRPTSLEKAASECLRDGSDFWSIEDEGKALTIQVAGLKRDSGLDDEEANCALKAAGAPDSIVTKMDNTTGEDGEQSTKWDGHEARWTFDVITGTAIQVTAK